ncbi:hypothetical protein PAMP_024452 [Pampus punctatissimus]
MDGQSQTGKYVKSPIASSSDLLAKTLAHWLALPSHSRYAAIPSRISLYQAQICHRPALSSSSYLLIPPFSLLQTPQTYQSLIIRIFFLLLSSSLLAAARATMAAPLYPTQAESMIDRTRQRLPPKNVYYYRCPDHRRNYVMSFAFCFDQEDDIYQFAYCYPYTYSRLQHYLASLERRNLPYLQREQLGLSVNTIFILFLIHIIPLSETEGNSERTDLAVLAHRIQSIATPAVKRGEGQQPHWRSRARQTDGDAERTRNHRPGTFLTDITR